MTDIIYLDVFDRLLLDGRLNPDLTIDDLHLNVEAARWCGMRAFHYQNDISRLRAALREAGIPVASER